MRALIWLGLRPRIDTSSAAVPATCGAAMLVPCEPMTGRVHATSTVTPAVVRATIVPLHAAHTAVCRPAGSGSAGPRDVFPPGAATLMAERPKFEWTAGASTSVHGPVRRSGFVN